jgi:hypothetical protein
MSGINIGLSAGFGEVDEVNMLMLWRDVFELNARRPHELPRIVYWQSALSVENDVHAGFLLDFTYRRLVGKLTRLNMPARWQPHSQENMAVEQHPPVGDDEDGNSKMAVGFNHRQAMLARAKAPGRTGLRNHRSGLTSKTSAGDRRGRKPTPPEALPPTGNPA